MVFGTAPIQSGAMSWLTQTCLRSKTLLICYGGTMYLLKSSILVWVSMAAHFNWPTQGARSRDATSKLEHHLDLVQKIPAHCHTKKSLRSSTRKSSSLYTTRKMPSSISYGTRTSGSRMTMKKPSSRRSTLQTKWAWVVYLYGRYVISPDPFSPD